MNDVEATERGVCRASTTSISSSTGAWLEELTVEEGIVMKIRVAGRPDTELWRKREKVESSERHRVTL